MQTKWPEPLLPHARRLFKAGFSLVPLAPRTKSPPKHFGWKRFQATPAEWREVRDWFADVDSHQLGIGIICGQGLMVADFDRREDYARWRREHPALAASLPSVSTHRGVHVYFQSDELPDRQRYPWGDLKCTGLVAAAPSLHPSGVAYGWLNELCGDVPRASLSDFGASPRQAVGTQVVVPQFPPLVVGAGQSLDDWAWLGVERTMPSGPSTTERAGDRNAKLFEYVRHLKGHPELANADPPEKYCCWWFSKAKDRIGDKRWDHCWMEFQRAWQAVRHPVGSGSLAVAAERAMSCEIPPWLTVSSLRKARLVLLGRELQRQAGDRPFFLASRQAAAILGVQSKQPHRTVWRLLCDDRYNSEVRTYIRLVASGSSNVRDRRANEYRYYGPF